MIKNWLVRGDTHGNFDWLEMVRPHERDEARIEETAVIILGDAGFNFFLNQRDVDLKSWVNKVGCRIYCVRGNHEARPQMTSAPYELVWDEDVGGEVYVEEQFPNIRFFKDFGEYVIDGYSVAVIGGAYSVDKKWRLRRAGIFDEARNNPKKTGWFSDEQLTQEEMNEASALFKNRRYDFVLSHTCPYSWRPTDLFLSFINQSSVDSTMERWMDELKEQIHWGIWLFGHYHADRLERPFVEMYFKDVERLEVIANRWEDYDEDGYLDWWLVKSPNFYMK